jgi:hypothetical protein
MVIGNRWVQNARLKILNGNVVLVAAWRTFPGLIQTNLTERGFLIGFNHWSFEVNLFSRYQILFDGQPPHQGFFRAATDFTLLQNMSTPEVATMLMPQLDIPPNTDVTVRGQAFIGGGVTNTYIDLFAVVYYIKDWEAALPAVCFPTDMVPPGQV